MALVVCHKLRRIRKTLKVIITHYALTFFIFRLRPRLWEATEERKEYASKLHS